MPRSRRYRKDQEKPQWGKNNPQTKAKNRKRLMIAIGVIAVAAVVVSAVVLLFPSQPTQSANVLFMVQGTNAQGQEFTGNITIQLRTDRPVTTKNFVNLVKEGFYDNTTFHRVMKDFMIQGGQNLSRTVANIQDEANKGDNHNYNGTIAMANTGEANTASSQFFINVADNNNRYSTFDSSYTVFGTITSGMDVVMEISNVECAVDPNRPSETSVPVHPVTLVKAIVLP